MSEKGLNCISKTDLFEELNKKFNELEQNLYLKLQKNNTGFEKNLGEIYEKIEFLDLKANEIDKNSLKSLNLSEKFSSFETSLIDSIRRLSNLEAKFENMNKNLKEAIFKYDKIYLENLFIPGIIGENCRFKNMKEFIENQINFYTTLMNFKEQASLDLKSNKSRLDSVIKSNLSSITDLEQNLKNYTNLVLNNYDQSSKANNQLIIDRINEIRFENNKYAVELINNSNALKAESAKFTEMQNEINLNLENTFSKYKQVNTKLTENFNEVIKEFEIIKRKFNETAEFIKDIRFKKNLQDLNLTELRRFSNKILDVGTLKDKHLLPDLAKSNSFQKKNNENSVSNDQESNDKINDLPADEETSNPVKIKRSIGHFNTISQSSYMREDFPKGIVHSSSVIYQINDSSPEKSSEMNSQVTLNAEKEKEKTSYGKQKNSFREDASNRVENNSYFFDKLNNIKKENFNRYKACDSRITEIESYLKTSIESILKQLKKIYPEKLQSENQLPVVFKEQEAPVKKINDIITSNKNLKSYGSLLDSIQINSDNFNSTNKSQGNKNITIKGKIKFSETLRSAETSLEYLSRSKSIGMKNLKKNN